MLYSVDLETGTPVDSIELSVAASALTLDAPAGRAYLAGRRSVLVVDLPVGTQVRVRVNTTVRDLANNQANSTTYTWTTGN